MPDDDATPGDTGRHLLRARDKAALASSLPPDGHPYASLVLVAADYDGSPILLISDRSLEAT